MSHRPALRSAPVRTADDRTRQVDTPEPDQPDRATAADDPLHAMRADLERVADVEVHERPELFERIHRALVAELNALEEVS